MKFNNKKSQTELTKYHFKDYWGKNSYIFENRSGWISINKWGEVELIIPENSDYQGRQELQKVFAKLVLDGMIIL